MTMIPVSAKKTTQVCIKIKHFFQKSVVFCGVVMVLCNDLILDCDGHQIFQ